MKKHGIINKLITSLIVVTIVVTMFGASVLPVFAQAETNSSFTGFSGDMSEEALESATNTIKNDDGAFTTPVSTSAPQLTFIIHGIGSSASAWSNNYESRVNSGETISKNSKLDFAYNSKSIIEKLREAGDSTVYYAKDTSNYSSATVEHSFSLQQLPDLCECGSKANKSKCSCIIPYQTSNYSYCNVITDVSTHILVVLELSQTQDANDVVYSQMNYIIDKIVYDVKSLNNGTLPRINLIGHSRGGITAMQYALDHPWLVDSMFAIGTPFLGTDLGELPKALELVEMSNDPQSDYYSRAVDDILNPLVYTEYMERWNDGYSEKYSHINFNCIVGYSTVGFLADVFKNDKYAKELLPNVSENAEFYADLLCIYNSWPAMDVFPRLDLEMDFLEGFGVDFAFSDIVELLAIFARDVKYEGFMGFGEFAIFSDFMVDYYSQSATGYQGANFFGRKFMPGDVDLRMRTKAHIPIVHNLEAGDAIIHSYVLDNIRLGVVTEASDSLKYYVNDGKASIRGVVAGFEETVLTIPDNINGYEVEEILPHAFRGKDIQAVVISGNVRSIGMCAFQNCKNLSSVTFVGGNHLQDIGVRAFYGCSSLTSFELPITVQRIDDLAFAGTGITTIDINPGLHEISPQAFSGAPLTAYTIDMYNYQYSVVDGVLYDYDGDTLIAYPGGKDTTDFILPSNVVEISEYSFAGASRLVRVNLSGVQHIPKGAFESCLSLETIRATSLTDIADGIFDYTLHDTKIMDSNESVIIGNVLVKYCGNDTDLNLNRYNVISSSAFQGNNTLESVTIGATTTRIGDYAFFNCSSLKEVYLNTGDVIDVGLMLFPSSVENIYVPAIRIDEYKSDDNWKYYISEIKTHDTAILFDTQGGSPVGNAELNYYSVVSLPVPEKSNYIFSHWMYTTDDGNVEISVYNGDIWLVWEDI